jgi:hypothetical protein
MLYRHKAWQSPMMIDTQRIYRNKPFPLPLLSNTFDYDTLISWLPLAGDCDGKLFGKRTGTFFSFASCLTSGKIHCRASNDNSMITSNYSCYFHDWNL